jgi:glycosyltransferase involved in cell wall biosynthesis
MTVLVNLSSVMPQPTGLSTYSLNIVGKLNGLDVDVVSPVVIPGCRCHPSPAGMSAQDGAKGHLKRLLWVQTQLPRLYQRLASRLLFSPIPEAPLGSNCRWVVTVHDLIPLHFPEQFSTATMLYNRHYISAVLRQAAHIICNSQATADDIIRFCSIPASQITPIPLAFDRENFRYLNLPTCNYFLYLGRINPYKNVQGLISAFALLPDRANYELWMAGPTDKRYQPALLHQLAELGLEKQVKFLDYVPYPDLAKVINQAIALVFPSLWEGFGLPVLEAMACGTPVISSNRASLPEVTGDGAILIDPEDSGAIARAMHQVAIDLALREQLRGTGLARAECFSWTKTGEMTVQVLQQYLN